MQKKSDTRVAEIGIIHKGCWHTNTITKFKEAKIIEISSRIYNIKDSIRFNKGFWKLTIDNNKKDLKNNLKKEKEVLSFIRKHPAVTQVRLIDFKDGEAYFTVIWKANTTSYDAVLNSGTDFSSSVYTKEGYETYTIFSKNINKLKRNLEKLESIDEVKIFNIKSKRKSERPYGLTQKELNALTQAINNDYYSWPRKIDLEKLSKKLGMKRRTFQDNLRRAERKVMPQLFDKI